MIGAARRIADSRANTIGERIGRNAPDSEPRGVSQIAAPTQKKAKKKPRLWDEAFKAENCGRIRP